MTEKKGTRKRRGGGPEWRPAGEPTGECPAAAWPPFAMPSSSSGFTSHKIRIFAPRYPFSPEGFTGLTPLSEADPELHDLIEKEKENS